MAVVLQTDDNSYFQSSPLRRSHSQPKFSTSHSSSSFHSASASRISPSHVKVFDDSDLSSGPSSPLIVHAETVHSSYASSTTSTTSVVSSATSASTHSLASRSKAPLSPPAQPDDYSSYGLPHYASAGAGVVPGYLAEVEELELPPSPRTGASFSLSPNDHDTTPTEDSSHPITPDCYEHAEDDLSLRSHPSRHVDYLSHNWREEDIWESWKYIVARKGDYTNSARLENASWRTWMKSKNKLRTVSPETLNWLKDCDVTWLYGPLQTGAHSLAPSRAESVETDHHSKSPATMKKPILKKRSMSEVMLQRSISTSSLVKQAAAAVQAQQKQGGLRPSARPKLERAATDYVTLPLSSRRLSPGTGSSSRFTSRSSSRLESPAGERKHIHFKEEVEQCIAVEIKGDDDDNFVPVDDSDSENEALMMRRTAIKKKRPKLRRNRSSTGAEKTIAMLPSTTLKSQDSPDTPESSSAMRHSYRSPTLTPSSSQETLRPANKKSSGVFSMGMDDSSDEDDEDGRIMMGQSKGKGKARAADDGAAYTGKGKGRADDYPSASLSGSSGSSSGGLKRSTSSNSLAATGESTGMRRTESGMLMPIEEGEDPPAANNGGLVGRVIDTYNTARDIVHVIWNVGWQ